MKKIMFILILFSSCAYNLCKKESVGVSDVCCVAPPKVSNAFGLTDKQWNKGDILYYTFLDGTSTQKKKVRDGFREISAISNLKYSETTNKQESIIRVTFKYSGNWSYVGKDNLLIGKNEPTMNFGDINSFTTQDIINRLVWHEGGHATGREHEHQHPFSPIQFDTAVVYRESGWDREQTYHNILRRYSHLGTYWGEFDVKSIMIYPIPQRWTTNGFFIPYNKSMSKGDSSYLINRFGSHCN